MRAQFDVERSNYPIAAIPHGEGLYSVANMIELENISEALLPYEVASTIATKANSLHRASRQHGWNEHGISPEVQSWIKVEVDEFVKAVERVFAPGESNAG